jgi:hypothetical protein
MLGKSTDLELAVWWQFWTLE